MAPILSFEANKFYNQLVYFSVGGETISPVRQYWVGASVREGHQLLHSAAQLFIGALDCLTIYELIFGSRLPVRGDVRVLVFQLP